MVIDHPETKQKKTLTYGTLNCSILCAADLEFRGRCVIEGITFRVTPFPVLRKVFMEGRIPEMGFPQLESCHGESIHHTLNTDFHSNHSFYKVEVVHRLISNSSSLKYYQK